MQAVVDDINSRGGILGRKIDAKIRTLDAQADGPTAYSQLCAGFTQDDKVFAVLAPWNPDPSFAPCLAKTGTFYTAMIGATLISGTVYLFLWKGLGLPQDRSYYVVVLSFLLIHYFYDHILFRDFGALETSYLPSSSNDLTGV